MYVKLPHNIDGFAAGLIELNDILNDEDENDEVRNVKLIKPYCSYDYISACISNTELAQKCMSISAIPLHNAINILRHNQGCKYIMFDLETCKLMTAHNCNLVSMLYIAYAVRNYESMKFIIENMDYMSMFYILTCNGFILDGILFILTIDRIKCINNNYLTGFLQNIIFSYSNKVNKIIIACYYVINYMSVIEGKQYMINENTTYNYITMKTDNVKYKIYTERQSFHNELLEFHFRPRGGHTKCAILNS
jgi:hypothetical protein